MGTVGAGCAEAVDAAAQPDSVNDRCGRIGWRDYRRAAAMRAVISSVVTTSLAMKPKFVTAAL